MKNYIIFILILAVIIPLTVKLTLNSVPTGGANTEPCMINFQTDSKDLDLDSNVPSSTMRPQQQINQEANETVQKINPFAHNFNDNYEPANTQIEDDSSVINQKRLGKKCEFGLCLPGK